MISQSDIAGLAHKIGEVANAQKVVLFGSYANGHPVESSDVDFLVVAESILPRHKRSREIYRRICPLHFPVDIIVYTPDEIRRNSATQVSFVSQALREGKTVYVAGT
jgi:predicted nucleotidyltransferase